MKFCEAYENFIMESLIFRARLEVNVFAEMDKKFREESGVDFLLKHDGGR